MENEAIIADSINKGDVVWTADLLQQLFGPRNYWRTSGFPQHWQELCMLLEYKLLRIETTKMSTTRIPIRGEKTYREMYELQGHSDSIELLEQKWITLKWLESSQKNVEYHCRYINFYLPDEKAYVRVGASDATRLLENFLKPGTSYYHVPLSDNYIVYILRTTEKYEVYYTEREKRRLQILRGYFINDTATTEL